MGKYIVCKHSDGTLFNRWILSGKLVDEKQLIRVDDNVQPFDENTVIVVPMENTKVAWVDPDGIHHTMIINKGEPFYVRKKFLFEDKIESNDSIASILKSLGWDVQKIDEHVIIATKPWNLFYSLQLNVPAKISDCIPYIKQKLDSCMFDEKIQQELLAIYDKIKKVEKKNRPEEIKKVLSDAGLTKKDIEDIIERLEKFYKE